MKKFKTLLILTITSALITSCGSDSGGSNSLGGSGWGVNNSSVGSMTSNVQQVHASLERITNCQSGSRKVVTANVQSGLNQGMNSTQLYGQLNEGALPGESGEYYSGISATGDILIISRASNGFNFYFSFCSLYFSLYNQQYPLLADGRGIQSLYMSSPTVLTASTYYPTNLISSANIVVTVPQYTANYNGYSVPVEGQTLYFAFTAPVRN